MIRLLSWNIARREDAWRALLRSGADVALLQEATEPPTDVAKELEVDSAPWRTAGAGLERPWRTAVVRLSDRVGVRWLDLESVEEAKPGAMAVSRPGTLSVAEITPVGSPPILVASLYATWERPHAEVRSNWIYADASVHRLISDLSALVGREKGHRIVAAGDLNVLRGYGEHGNLYWADRYASVFDRMAALGLNFVGPRAPAGRRADPWPDELPRLSDNVPTFHTNRQSPASATRQLDFVFASAGLDERVAVRASNDPSEWGASDHCQIEISVG
jgi:exonuclease III